VPAQGESSTTLRLTRIEADNSGDGSCPLFVAGYDAWDDLSLEYRIPWPVHLLLTPPVRPHRICPLPLSEATGLRVLTRSRMLYDLIPYEPHRSAELQESTAECEQVMARYGAIFKLLLRLRRVEDSLHAAWSAMRASDRGSGSPAPSAARWLPLWRLRSQMAHFVGNLQIYLQVGVLAPGRACSPCSQILLVAWNECRLCQH